MFHVYYDEALFNDLNVLKRPLEVSLSHALKLLPKVSAITKVCLMVCNLKRVLLILKLAYNNLPKLK